MLGGAIADWGSAIAVDLSGNAYVAGYTQSSTFPTTTGAFQTVFKGSPAYVAKLNPAGNGLVYSTLLGGSKQETSHAIVLDAAGNAYVTGTTTSTDFPTTNAAYQKTLKGTSDAFVAKLNPTASALVFSTLVGGSGDDDGLGLALASRNAAITDPAVWMVGDTNGQADFPTVGPITTCGSGTCPNGKCHSGIVTQLAADGSSLIFSTCMGPAGTDYIVNGVGVTSDGIRTAVKTFTPASGASPTRVSRSEAAAAEFPDLVAFLDSSAGLTSVSPSNGCAALPVLVGQAGTVGAASGGKLAPSGITSSYGLGMATGTTGASGIPLATQLNGTKVTLIGGKAPVDAPLFFAAAGQINFQMPWELLGSPMASLIVTNNGSNSAPVIINLSTLAPAIFTLNSQGTGQGIVLVSATGEFAAPSGSIPGVPARPVRAGEFITIYCSGLGDVSNRPATGAASPANPISNTLQPVTVSLGGVQTPASFAGLTPGLVALYQVNVQIPSNVAPGSAVSLSLTIGGTTSNTVTIAVQ